MRLNILKPIQNQSDIPKCSYLYLRNHICHVLTTEDSLKVIGYAWLPMVVWPLLTAQTIRHPQIFLKHAPCQD